MNRGEKARIGSEEGVTEQVVVALRRIIRAIDVHSRSLIARCGLTGPQVVVLKELSRHRAAAVSELTQAVHLSQATVTGILDRLERRGLVQRRRSDQDRRRVMVWLTSAGERILSEAPPLLQEDFIREFSTLADWEQTQILSSLQRVVLMMEAKHLDAAPILTTGPINPAPERPESLPKQVRRSPEAGLSTLARAETATGLEAEPPRPGPKPRKKGVPNDANSED